MTEIRKSRTGGRGRPRVQRTEALLDLGQFGRRLADSENVERRNRPLETLERELAGRFHLDGVFDLGVEPLRDQDLPAGRPSASRDARFVTAPIAA